MSLPTPVDKWGSTYYDGFQWQKPDPQMDRATAALSPLSRLIRATAQRDDAGRWSKHPDDMFTLDASTVGLFHFAKGNVPKVAAEVAACGTRNECRGWKGLQAVPVGIPTEPCAERR